MEAEGNERICRNGEDGDVMVKHCIPVDLGSIGGSPYIYMMLCS